MNKVFVGSLSWNVNEQELGDFFAQIGDIEEVKIITDRETGRSKGFGFITFVEEDSAQKSVDELDGKELDGRSIKVSIARDKGSDRRGGGRPSGAHQSRGGFGGGNTGGNFGGGRRNRW